MENHSTSDIQRATPIPSNNDINCITVFFKAGVPLFISASTPARAMYIKPPAVNPCKFGTQTFVVTTPTDHQKHCSTAQLFTSIKDDCPGSLPHIKAWNSSSNQISIIPWVSYVISLKKKIQTRAVPANAASADRKLKKRALEALKPDLTKIPKSPICKNQKQYKLS